MSNKKTVYVLFANGGYVKIHNDGEKAECLLKWEEMLKDEKPIPDALFLAVPAWEAITKQPICSSWLVRLKSFIWGKK